NHTASLPILQFMSSDPPLRSGCGTACVRFQTFERRTTGHNNANGIDQMMSGESPKGELCPIQNPESACGHARPQRAVERCGQGISERWWGRARKQNRSVELAHEPSIVRMLQDRRCVPGRIVV